MRFDLYIPKDLQEKFLKFKEEHPEHTGRKLLWKALQD